MSLSMKIRFFTILLSVSLILTAAVAMAQGVVHLVSLSWTGPEGGLFTVKLKTATSPIPELNNVLLIWNTTERVVTVPEMYPGKYQFSVTYNGVESSNVVFIVPDVPPPVTWGPLSSGVDPSRYPSVTVGNLKAFVR